MKHNYNNFEIWYDIHTIDESDIKEIAELLHNETGLTIQLRERARYATGVEILIVLGITLAIKKFIEGFSKKVGEKLGEEVGDDLVVLYRKIKDVLKRKLENKKNGKGYQILFEIHIDEILIRGVLVGNDGEYDNVDNSIEEIKSMAELAMSLINDFDDKDKITEVRLVFDNSVKEWKPFLIATNDDVFRINEYSTSEGGSTLVYNKDSRK